MSNPDPWEDEQTERDDAATARKVLKTDLLASLVFLVIGVFEARGALFDLGFVAVIVCLATVGGLYLTEHDAVPGIYPEVVAVASLLAIGGVVGALLAFTSDATRLVLATALVGFATGVFGYRTVFGVVRPVPEIRLSKSRE